MSNNKQSSVDKEFVPYEEALALKELGYNEPYLMVYFNPIQQLPTYSQAFRWFDENTELMGFVVPSIKDEFFDWVIRDGLMELECDECYESRSIAELACLRKLIEIEKEKQQ